MDATRLAVALSHANVGAFLRVIREGESDQTDAAYTIINGGARFSSFAAHPFGELPTTRGGRASGAYQFLPTTWADLRRRYPWALPDFSPRSQDVGAVLLIYDRGALDDVLAGRFAQAVAGLRSTWTSLPGAAENSGRFTMERARDVYRRYGGALALSDLSDSQPPAPIEDRSVPAQARSPEVAPMGPLVIPILSAIASFVPALAKIFNDGTVKGQRIEAVAPLISDAIVKVTGAVNLQDAAEKIQADPLAQKAAAKAVETVVYELSEVGGGIEAARAHSVLLAQQPGPLWKMPSFIVTLLLFPMIYGVVAIVVSGEGFATIAAAIFTDKAETIAQIRGAFSYSQDIRIMVITAVVSGVLAGITGFWLGTSYGSQRKTDVINAKG